MKIALHSLKVLTIVCLCFFAAQPLHAAKMKKPSDQKPIALVYKGSGACDDGCSESAAQMATLAGFSARFVGPEESDLSIFNSAKLYIQPGGTSKLVAAAMTEKMKDAIRGFVASGGGYVGFCAGAFFAAETFHNRKGLGIFKGVSLFEDTYETDAEIVTLRFANNTREIYWEGGPHLVPNSESDYQITSYYPNGHIASVQGEFGAGKIAITGLHPEAPQSWRNFYNLADKDGLDYDLAVDMIRYVTPK